MATQSLTALADALGQARAAHAEKLEQVKQARLAYEEASRELSQLEERIAELEREAREVGPAENSPRLRAGPGLRSALLIVNPHSGIMANGGQMLDEIRDRLRANGIAAELGMRKSARGTRRVAKEAAQEGNRLIIVAGGDGTIEDVASQLPGSQATLGIIPVGTMNNIARSLGIPLGLQEACELIGLGLTRSLDIGRVVAHVQPELEFFLETAGVGLSAIAIPAGDMAKSGRWSAIPDALRKLFNIHPERIVVELDDGEVVETTSQVVTVSNAPLIGNNILVAPEAKMDDGMLDIGLYEGMNKAELLAHFVAASNGTRAEDPRINWRRARRVRIHAPEPLDVHSDKDPLGARRAVEIELLPACIPTIVGDGIGLSLPVQAAPTAPPLSGPQTEP